MSHPALIEGNLLFADRRDSMSLSTDTLWFEVAVMATLIALGHCLLGHFEERTAKWRKVVKLVAAIGGSVLISATFGRVWLFVLLGLCAFAVVLIHVWWLPRNGINGWTGEPKELYYKLRGWTSQKPTVTGSNGMSWKLRFNFRVLLVLSILVAIPFWWVAREIAEYEKEKASLARMQEVNPRMRVIWENQTPKWFSSIGIHPEWMNRIIRLDATGVTCGGLEWKDYPDSQIDFGDEELEQIIGDINSLHNLREICFQVTKLSDRSVDYFATLRKLQYINLQVTDITMNGAQILKNQLQTTTVEHDTAIHPVRMKH